MARTFAFATLVMLWGCASHPDRISAAGISPTAYRDYDCPRLATEMQNVATWTAELYDDLEAERLADDWQMGLGLLGVFPTLFFLEGGDGPNATEYAQLKGYFAALQANAEERNCDVSAQAPEDIVAAADMRTESVVVSKTDPPTGYVDVGTITGFDGTGCGAYGRRGTYEQAVARLRGNARRRGVDYVKVVEVIKPHAGTLCFDNGYELHGTAYRRPPGSSAPATVGE